MQRAGRCRSRRKTGRRPCGARRGRSSCRCVRSSRVRSPFVRPSFASRTLLALARPLLAARSILLTPTLLVVCPLFAGASQWNFVALGSRLGKPDRDRLFAALALPAGPPRFEFPPFHLMHRTLDLLAGTFRITSRHETSSDLLRSPIGQPLTANLIAFGIERRIQYAVAWQRTRTAFVGFACGATVDFMLFDVVPAAADDEMLQRHCTHMLLRTSPS